MINPSQDTRLWSEMPLLDRGALAELGVDWA
jgi:hypothetical protein